MKKPGAKKPKRKVWSFSEPTFNARIWVSVAPTLKSAAELLGYNFASARTQLNGDFAGVGMSMTDAMGNFAVAFAENKLSHDVIAHELDHVVTDILEYIGEDRPGKECRGYLSGFMAKRVYRILHRNSVAVNLT